MLVSDITILKSVDPIVIQDKPTPRTLKFLALLLNSPDSSELITTMRNQFNVSYKNITPYTGTNFQDLPYSNNEILNSALEIISNDLVKKLGLSGNFNLQLKLLIFYNAFIDLEFVDIFISQPIQFILGKKNIASEMFEYPQEIGAILIPYNISQNTLIDWIGQNWESINKKMDQNLTADPFILRRQKNIEFSLEIAELKDRKKMSFSKITNYLSEKYPDDSRITSEEWVKKVYRDFKELHSKPLVQPQ